MGTVSAAWRRAWDRPVGRYAISLLLTGAAALIRAAFFPVLGTRSPYLFLLPAVLIAAWFGGLGPGIAAMAASIVLAPLLFTPLGRFAEARAEDWASLAFFLIVNLCLLLATDAARRGRSAAQDETRRTREILDQLGVGFVVLGNDWRYVFVNPEAERILGRPARELLGKDMRQVFPLDPFLLQRLRRGMDARETVEFETFYEPWNRWFLVRVFPVREGLGIFFLDITQRKSNEQAVQESRRMLIHALEGARMGYWIWDIGSGSVSWSENLEEVHRLPRGSFGGTFEAFLELVHPEDRPRLQEAIRRALSEGGEYDIEFRIVTPDGAVEWIAGRGHVETRDGKAVRMIGLGTNVTARKAAEGERGLLASIVRSSDDAILSKDLDGRIMSWNAAAERIYGYSASEAVGQPVSMLVPPEKREELSAIMDRIRRGEGVEHYETLRRRRDGTVFEVALTISPIFDEAGRIIGASKIARDISAAKAAERERQRTRELFIGMLGHDLRNPLNTIVASLYSLEKSGSESVRRSCSRMSRAAERMARMIEHLLDFTRARLGEGIPVQPVAADLGRLCSDVLEELEPQYPGRVRLETEGDLDGRFDPDRVKQAISNLVGNAVAHGSPDEPVRVRCWSERGQIHLEVANGGAPIPTEDRATIFEPFRRSHSSSIRDSSGLGLGLFIVREIVRSHGGTIELTSDSARTRFVMRFPGSAAPGAPN